MIFISCNLVSCWWQWSVDLHKNKKKKHAKGETIHKPKRKQGRAQNRKEKYKKKRI
jgi:hypothetical protein